MADSIEWVTDAERLAELVEPWTALLGASSTPFDQPEWFAAWWTAFGQPGRLRACAAWRNGRLVAILPLEQRGRRSLAAMANLHTPAFRPVSADAEALEAVVSASLDGGSVRLEAFGVPSEEPALRTLVDHAERLGMHPVIEPVHVSPIVETTGDFERWRAASKPRWSAPLERFRRKMRRDHDARFTIVESPVDLDDELSRGFAVEAGGWKGERGTAILSSPQTEAFYRILARSYHERDELRLSRIELDGKIAAFDLTLLQGNRLYLLKTGFEEAFRRLAPGLVMRLSIIERCFELGLDAHELLGDDSKWKQKFSTTERAHTRLRAYERGPVGIGHYGYRTLARPLAKRARDGFRRRSLHQRRNG
jgi:CelD/BcsL family acetyltransferase involved in cellulose biosynthesis